MARPSDDGALGRRRPRGGYRDTQEIARAFRDAYFTLERRIELFLSLPLASLAPSI